MKKLINDIASRAENSNHLFETISTYGTILEAIRETVKKKETELIVMGTKGENNPAQKIYGSTAVDVMEKIRNTWKLAEGDHHWLELEITDLEYNNASLYQLSRAVKISAFSSSPLWKLS